MSWNNPWFLVKRSAPGLVFWLLCIILGQNPRFCGLHFDLTAQKLPAIGYDLLVLNVHAWKIINDHHQNGLRLYFEHCTWYLLLSNLHSALCRLHVFWALSYRSILYFFSFVCTCADFGSVTMQLIKRILYVFAFFCASVCICYFSNPVIYNFTFSKQWIVYIMVALT